MVVTWVGSITPPLTLTFVVHLPALPTLVVCPENAKYIYVVNGAPQACQESGTSCTTSLRMGLAW